MNDTRRSSILVSGNSTWYDVPAPVIVHSRSFSIEKYDEYGGGGGGGGDVGCGGDDDDDDDGGANNENPSDEDNERVEEIILSNRSSSSKCVSEAVVEVLYQNQVEAKLNSLNAQQCSCGQEAAAAQPRKRYSTSIELTAATTLSSDSDGVPVITFSFVRADQQPVDQVDAALYDVPRAPLPAIEAIEPPTESPSESHQLYEVVGASEAGSSSASERRLGGFKARRSSSSKSLKWRRSLGKLEDLVRPSHAGSHSDSEAPDGSAARRRKLGKAWGRMRTWLSEERSKLSGVVARHARLQAVGARLDDVAEESAAQAYNGGAQSGSYDLTKARLGSARQASCLPRVEEFGLEQVAGEEARVTAKLHLSIKKTASSDDILGERRQPRALLPAATSFSLERLCSDDGAALELSGGDSAAAKKLQTRRYAKGGLIKKRMLGSIRGLIANAHLLHDQDDESGPGGFEEVRKYVKQGGDFCKELAAILHERAELEATYAKGLSKLSAKLTKACAKDQGGNGSGGVSEAWRCVGEEMETAAEAHRAWGGALGEQLAKPLRVGVAEVQGRTRKSIENSVDKASKSLQEWRTVAAKTKKQSFACARENERLQDLARLQSLSQSHHQQQHQHQNNKLASNGHHHVSEKEATKLESRRRKAEEAARRADNEFYTVTVRAERARLEYECTVRKAAKQMELLEEERLSALKDFANVYLAHLQALAPKLQQSVDRLSQPIRSCSVSQDVEILKNLIRRIDSGDTSSTEQLLPDFYAEHVTLAMNRERRKQALVRVLHLIRQDLERERRGREGLETLHRAFIKTPAFAADESTQNVTDKLLHMRSMLTYLEAARYKVSGALSELEGGKKSKHPLAEHILVSRDKQGLQQSVLKVPSWVKNESFEYQDTSDGELEVLHLSKSNEAEHQRDWADRTAGDGNSENQPDEEDFSDFDEFSSNSEDNNNQDCIDATEVSSGKTDDGLEKCRAIYQYSANLNDELSLSPGDLITVHEKQADGWWIGECRGRTGIFPATYVQVIN
ncbi:uncharacterized protein LOC131666527 isoform X2 [Phymastichus coffea]|uniref:uncharacterized protein LOC131666527 isoform X2 n=1 Tax=Phymastichus coffea TaxID=108790 RepID=UPI00273AA743|nr:uncharacterized protein LOC131666527 isoform X2 [Phymastichus coffea]